MDIIAIFATAMVLSALVARLFGRLSTRHTLAGFFLMVAAQCLAQGLIDAVKLVVPDRLAPSFCIGATMLTALATITAYRLWRRRLIRHRAAQSP